MNAASSSGLARRVASLATAPESAGVVLRGFAEWAVRRYSLSSAWIHVRLPGEQVEVSAGYPAAPDAPLPQALLALVPLAFPPLRPGPPVEPAALANGQFCCGVSPVVGRDGEAHGALIALSDQPGALGPEDLETLRHLGTVIAACIQRMSESGRRFGDGPELESIPRRYAALFENTTDLVFTQDTAGRLTAVNQAAEILTGYKREELLAMRLEDLVVPEHREAVRQMLLEQYGGGSSQLYEVSLCRRDGTLLFCEISAHLLFQQGQPVGLMGFARDVTGLGHGPAEGRGVRETLERRLSEMSRELSELGDLWTHLHRLTTSRYRTLRDLVTDCLRTGCEVLGLPAGFVVARSAGCSTLISRYPEGRSDPFAGDEAAILNYLDVLFHDRPVAVLSLMDSPKLLPVVWARIEADAREWGLITFVSYDSAPAPAARAREFVDFLAARLTARLADEQLAASRYDHLTGLLQGRIVTEKLEDCVKSRGGRSRTAAILVDLDLLAQVNHQFGYATGDRVLRECAGRMAACMGRTGDLGRLGSDRFLAVCPSVGSRQEALELAGRLVDAVRAPVQSGDVTVAVTASAGVAVYPDDAQQAKALLSLADSALQLAKEQGRNHAVLHGSEASGRRSRRLSLEVALQGALEHREFFLRFQPQVRGDGQLRGLEALVGWNHPEMGRIPASHFVPLAEENGLIIPIGAWVLEESCRLAAAWRKDSGTPVRLAVNASIRQLENAAFVELVERCLSDHGLPPHLLEIEVTESSIMKDQRQSLQVLRRLRQIGVRLAIDDFGTGYSSLSYLSRLPVNTLKIDRSFLDEPSSGDRMLPTIEMIVRLAGQLGLEVIGEGVEHESHWELLRRAGCDAFQGYFLGTPVTEDEVPAVLGSVWKLAPGGGRPGLRRGLT